MSPLPISVPLYEQAVERLNNGLFPKQEIKYRMGTNVLTDDVAIYIIYYGKWSAEQKSLINEFTDSLGGSGNLDLLIRRMVEYYEKILLPK